MKKKLLALLLCTQLIAGQSVFAAITVPEEPNEPVQLIVEIDGDPLCTLKGIDAPSVQSRQANALLKTQAKVLGEISESTNEEITPIYTYTELFNGFSIETTRDQIEKIRALPNVKTVEEVLYFTITEPMLETSGDLMDLPLADGDLAYRGEGQAVAVIDSEFDVNHAFFNMTPANPKLTSASIQASGLSYPNTYKSSKIPFAYDYVRKTNDTYSTKNIHGTHVAGIIGGKETTANGRHFSGIAPESQLVLMKIADEDGTLSTNVLNKALDDACKMGVDCVNMSFGIDYIHKTYSRYSLAEKSIENLRAAGISVACANGNVSRGFQKKAKALESPDVTRIDYSAGGVPNGFSDCTAIASLTNSARAAMHNGQMSSFSSWGTSDDLELKPELTAPGGKIYSSVPNNQYQTMSGTSMAAPHAAAAFTLMNQFYQTNPFSAQNNGKAGGEKSALLENLMMSTAAIQKQADGTYYSPRLQGAGLINLQNAVKTPAILLGNSGKSKISLGDQLTNEFTLTATVQNLTDQPVTYHSISVTTLLDGYTADHRVGASKPIANESDVPSAITVPANGSQPLQISVTLDADAISEQARVFTNGFFIDGFLELSSNDNIVPIHLPFTGFYGDWLDEPIFDRTIYDEGGSQLISEDGAANGTFLYTKIGEKQYPLGQNEYNGLTDQKWIALSPTGTDNSFYLGFYITPWRNVGKVEILMSGARNFKMEANDLQKFNGNAFAYILPTIPDGDYQLEITGYYPTDTEKTRPQTMELPLVIDSQKPDITGYMTGSVLTVFPADNHYVEYVQIVYEDRNGQEKSVAEPVVYPDDTAAPLQFDLSDADQSTVRITVCDYADNKTERTLEQCLNPITTTVNSNIANQISFTAENIGYEKTVDLYIAFYNGKRLVSVIPHRNVTLQSGNNTYWHTLSGTEKTADSYSILYWNTGTVHPVSQAYHK